MVYVDELRKWPGAPYPFQSGSCHLTADTEEELHEFAAGLGMKRGWFQSQRVPHYDLTAKRRSRALDLGAVFLGAKEQARRRIEARRLILKEREVRDREQ